MAWLQQNQAVVAIPAVMNLLQFIAQQQAARTPDPDPGQEMSPPAMRIPVEEVWGEFCRLLRARMKLPRGGANGGGSMQTLFEIPMVTKATAEVLFADWPKRAGEKDPCWELSTMAQCETLLAFQSNRWCSTWGWGNARPLAPNGALTSCVLLAAPPITVRLRSTTEGLRVLQVNLALVLFTETNTVVLPPDVADPATGRSIPFYVDPRNRPGLHRDVFAAHAKRMVGELMRAGFLNFTPALAALAPAEYQELVAAASAAADEVEAEKAGLYMVEAIVGQRSKPGRRGRQATMEYMVRWRGWEEPTWEPVKYLAKLEALRVWKEAQPA